MGFTEQLRVNGNLATIPALPPVVMDLVMAECRGSYTLCPAPVSLLSLPLHFAYIFGVKCYCTAIGAEKCRRVFWEGDMWFLGHIMILLSFGR